MENPFHSPEVIHLLFDLAAVAVALTGGWAVYRWRLHEPLVGTAASIGPAYFAALTCGSIGGAFLFGTLNLYLSGIPMLGRSVLGALFGATMTVELYKKIRGTKGSTGYIYVVPFSLCIIVGRLGCYFTGLSDNTYGIATALPWGHDFGDHVLRHPVQLYESTAMAVFVLFFIWLLKNRLATAVCCGYYLCTGFYALQRFVWEFLKPYGAALGPFNLFHLLCLMLMIYSLYMIKGVYDAGASHRKGLGA